MAVVVVVALVVGCQSSISYGGIEAWPMVVVLVLGFSSGILS